MVVDGARRRIVLVAPDFIQQFVAADDPVGVLHQELERLEFLRGQDYDLPIALDFHFLEIGGDAVETDDLHLGDARGVAECGPNAGQQFAWTERLGDVVVRSQLQQQDFVGDVTGCTKHDNRQRRGDSLDLLTYVPSGNLGQAQIQDYGCRRGRLEAVERGPAIGLRFDGITLCLE